VQLPGYIENIKEKLAENIHELWAMGKVEQGWQYDEVGILLICCFLILGSLSSI